MGLNEPSKVFFVWFRSSNPYWRISNAVYEVEDKPSSYIRL